MRIYSMTATFGKLEHETLTLDAGLNVIHAPNEWGKTTWCSFLVAMLYGLETRAKSTKTALADKDRYAPWSGSPMAGRIDLQWQDRDITIERKTKGRVPLGDFRAYETRTGLPVTELTAANCGQLLLGVERSVFLRSGFIRFGDLPVTNDEALRRRLNSLVTTGDESSAGDRLAEGLKELKNRVRYNRTGLLPQVEEECAGVEKKLAEIESYQTQIVALRRRQEECTRQLQELENHSQALAFADAEADALRVVQAREERDNAADRLRKLDNLCANLPDRQQLTQGLDKIGEYERMADALEAEAKLCSGEVRLPEVPAFARGMDPEKVLEKAIANKQEYENLAKRKPWPMLLGIALALVGALAALRYLLPGLIGAALGIALLVIGLMGGGKRKNAMAELVSHYGSDEPDEWVRVAREYKSALEQAQAKQQHLRKLQQDVEERRRALEEKIHRITQGKGLRACKELWQKFMAQWAALENARRDLQRTEEQLKTVSAMAKTAEAPRFPDALRCSAGETQRQLSLVREELWKSEQLLSRYAGRMEELGDPEALRRKLPGLYARRKKLEDTYAALSLAQDTLVRAKQELQRKFAPRISGRAEELMAAMTDGRYDRFRLGEDFTLSSGADQEDTLHEVLWRSAGTVDQLYLALRLAVSEALVPEAPLILDDALVRFDDNRLKATMNILEAEAANRQVILFTCQSREKNLMNPGR